MLTYQIVISDIVIEVEKKRIKNLRLSVHPPDGAVKISVPLLYKDALIHCFLESKLPWIKKHKDKYYGKEKPVVLEFATGEYHYYLGERYVLQVIQHNKSPRIELTDGSIYLYIKPGSTKHQRKKAVDEWYRKQLKDISSSLIIKWENIIGVNVNEFGIKNMKTRWGSCNIRAKRIWLNLELGGKPFHCLEFIIVHELVHLLERNHSAKFKSFMDKFLPEWRGYKDELNKTHMVNQNREF